MDEYMKFPISNDHDDMLDALSRIADAETGPLIIAPAKKSIQRITMKQRMIDYDEYVDTDYIPF